MSRILIMGATGTVGCHAASQLSSTRTQVRALVRNPDVARDPSAQLQFVQGLSTPETLYPHDPAIQRIANKAQRIVFRSAPFKTAQLFFQQPNQARNLAEKVERLIENSGLQWAFPRPGAGRRLLSNQTPGPRPARRVSGDLPKNRKRRGEGKLETLDEHNDDSLPVTTIYKDGLTITLAVACPRG